MLRTLLLILTLALLPAGASATFMTYTDRGQWEAAAAGAGLVVETEDFATDPGSSFTVGGADFDFLAGTYNPVGECLHPTSSELSVDYVSGGPIFGIGMDFGAAFGPTQGTPSLTVSDGSQVESISGLLTSSSGVFLGILSTQPLDPDCPLCGTPSEVFMQVQFGSDLLSADNLSVAVIPEPGTALLMAGGLGGLALAGRRRTRRLSPTRSRS